MTKERTVPEEQDVITQRGGYLRRARDAQNLLSSAGFGRLNWIGPTWITFLGDLDPRILTFLCHRIKQDSKLRRQIRDCVLESDLRRLQTREVRKMIAEYGQVTGKRHQTLPRLMDRTADEFDLRAVSRETAPRCEIDAIFAQHEGSGADKDSPPEAAAGLLDRVLRAEALRRSGAVVQGRPQREARVSEDARSVAGGVFVSVRRSTYALGEL